MAWRAPWGRHLAWWVSVLMAWVVCGGEAMFTRVLESLDGGPNMYSLQEGQGMAKGSSINLKYTYLPPSQPSRAAFVLLVTDRQLNTYYQQLITRPEDNHYQIMCNAPSAMRVQLSTSDHSGHFTFTVRYTDHYSLRLLQCTETFTGLFRLQVDVDILQPDSSGRLVHHLPLEDQMLPTVYLGLLLTVLLLLLLWGVELWLTWEYVTGVHLACAASLALKMVDMIVQLSYHQILDRYGSVAPSLRTGTRVASKLSTLSQLAVLFLISLGWKVTRSQISGREMRLLLVTFGLYVCFSSSQAACPDEDSQKDKLCEAYVLTEYVLHSVILLGIIVSVNFNITHLRATLNDYPWSSNVPLQYRSLKQFQRFRWAFLLYLLLPTIILIIKIMVLSWAYSWLEALFKEACFLLIYVLIAIDFSPGPTHLYTSMFLPEGPGGLRQQDERRQE